MAEHTPNGENDVRDDPPDADRLEEDWNRALDAATGAVSASSRAHALDPEAVSDEAARIHSEREWLNRFRPTLRRLFPRRRRSEEPPSSS